MKTHTLSFWLFFSLALPVTLVASEPSTLPAASESAAGQDGCASEQPASTVKSSKSNSSDRTQSPANPPPVPAATSNLNLSKSNINRSKGCPEAVDEPAAATTVKSSKSNSSE